jgi:P4 family phage/plasmid primase-like protien
MNDTTIFNNNINKKEKPKVEIQEQKPKEMNMDIYLQWVQVNNYLITKQQKQAADLSSDLILAEHGFKTMFDNEEIWFYENGCYYPQGANAIKKILQEQEPIKEVLSSHFVNEVIHSIIRKTYIKREEFEAPQQLICLGNGIYNIEKNQLINHDKKYYFKNKIEIDYNPTSTCPNIDKFLTEIVEEKNIPMLLEIPAYLLVRNYKIQKAIMLNGTNDNGKSVYIKLLETLTSQKNYSSEELQQICHSTFSKAELFGKLMNSCADLPATIMENTGDFKKLTSGNDTISAQRKFGQPFQFINYAKLIFSANEVPESKDTTDAFFKRWIIIDFPYKFIAGLPEEKYDSITKKADLDLINKLTTKEELEGLLLKCINLIPKLQEQGCFSNTPTIEEIKKRYLMKSNSAVVFIETELTDLTPDEEAENPKYEPFVVKEFLWSEYVDFCKANRTNPKTLSSFYTELKVRWNPQTEKRTVELGVRKNCFVGIRYVGSWRFDD